MKCALAAMGFINGDLQHNHKQIVDTMIAYSTKADIVIFGEAFLQGFDGVTFHAEQDAQIAISQDDSIMTDICSIARQHKIAVSFGFIEKTESCFYSSQATIDQNGAVIDVYRRVSPGWKESFANEQYRQGDGFHAFGFMGKSIVIGLCGDLWYDENVRQVKHLHPDVVFWPVYTDFNADVWNATEKCEYAAQAGKVCDEVLYVNSVCKDQQGPEIARGGAAHFEKGRIRQEIPSGKEAVLLVEI